MAGPVPGIDHRAVVDPHGLVRGASNVTPVRASLVVVDGSDDCGGDGNPCAVGQQKGQRAPRQRRARR